jgi:hypothetical protein
MDITSSENIMFEAAAREREADGCSPRVDQDPLGQVLTEAACHSTLFCGSLIALETAMKRLSAKFLPYPASLSPNPPAMAKLHV